MRMRTEFFNSADADKATLKIYSDIGDGGWFDEGFTNKDVEKVLDEANGKPLDIYINSYGGEVFEGFAIYNILKRYTGKKTVYVDGIAASIASVIAMAGDKIVMNEASMMMIHNASSFAYGTYKEMEQVADALKKINDVIRDVYMNKVNITKDKLEELMDNESHLTAEECVKYGFADEMIKSEEPEKEPMDKARSQFLNELDNRIKTLNSLKNYKSLEESGFFNAPKVNQEERVEPEQTNKLKKFFSGKSKGE